MTPTLARRMTAEAVGTALLVAVVVGSGILAERLSPNDTGLQLLENSLATDGGLVALILAFGSVSGAHFNPVVTLADRVLGGMTTREVLAYVPAQIVGACAGAVVANVMFELDPVTLSTHTRSSGGLWVGEIVATFGLLIVILGVCRSGRVNTAPFAVAGYGSRAEAETLAEQLATERMHDRVPRRSSRTGRNADRAELPGRATQPADRPFDRVTGHTEALERGASPTTPSSRCASASHQKTGEPTRTTVRRAALARQINGAPLERPR